MQTTFFKQFKSIFEPHFSTRDKIFFVQRLAFLLDATISLQESLFILKRQSHKRFIPIYISLETAIAQGSTLASAMHQFSRSFTTFMCTLVESGEKTGLLKENLLHCAQELERSQTLQRKIISAALYPCIIALSTIGLSTFLLIGIFPKVQSLFQSLHATLPLPTKILISLSTFFQHYWLLVSIFFLILSIAIPVAIQKNIILKKLWHSFILQIPLIGNLIKNYTLSMLFRMLGIMTSIGVPLDQALRQSKQLVSNLTYTHQLDIILNNVTNGKQFSATLTKAPDLFPPLAIQCIEIGERTGSLSKNCIEISKMLDADIDHLLKTITSLIEPLLMISMGLIVGFISLSIIAPIYEITQHIKH